MQLALDILTLILVIICASSFSVTEFYYDGVILVFGFQFSYFLVLLVFQPNIIWEKKTGYTSSLSLFFPQNHLKSKLIMKSIFDVCYSIVPVALFFPLHPQPITLVIGTLLSPAPLVLQILLLRYAVLEDAKFEQYLIQRMKKIIELNEVLTYDIIADGMDLTDLGKDVYVRAIRSFLNVYEDKLPPFKIKYVDSSSTKPSNLPSSKNEIHYHYKDTHYHL